MIAIECFKKFRLIDIAAIFILSVVWYLISLAVNLIPDPSQVLPPLAMVIFMTFVVFLIGKAGSAVLFYFFIALISFHVPLLGIMGVNKLITLVVAGIVFELVFLILKIELKNIPLDVVIGAAFSNAVIPIVASLLVSFVVVRQLLFDFLNLVLLYFIIGIAGSVISFLIWYRLKTTKMMIRFEYM